MKNSNSIPRLSRLVHILILLQSRRIITAAQIANRFDISKRTAYRDIKALEEAGVPIFVEEGKGYSLMEGYVLPPVMFSEEEANALIAAQQIIAKNTDKSLKTNYLSAIEKLKAVLKYTQKDKAELLESRMFSFENFHNKTNSNWLSPIQLAITNQIVLKIDYISISKEEKTQRMIEPLALYLSQNNWVVVAWCRMREAYREFRLDRIQHINQLDEQFDDQNFDLFRYFKRAYGS